MKTRSGHEYVIESNEIVNNGILRTYNGIFKRKEKKIHMEINEFRSTANPTVNTRSVELKNSALTAMTVTYTEDRTCIVSGIAGGFIINVDKFEGKDSRDFSIEEQLDMMLEYMNE